VQEGSRCTALPGRGCTPAVQQTGVQHPSPPSLGPAPPGVTVSLARTNILQNRHSPVTKDPPIWSSHPCSDRTPIPGLAVPKWDSPEQERAAPERKPRRPRAELSKFSSSV
uniref:Uncharacterized protein n=1 Tax=Corvus moneduloides TaxID=1196302 RepID=A0A8C3E079_CORMO